MMAAVHASVGEEFRELEVGRGGPPPHAAGAAPAARAAALPMQHRRSTPPPTPPLQGREKDMYTELLAVTEYFGEDYALADPTRILRTVRDFVVLFDKAVDDIEVSPAPPAGLHAGEDACSAGAGGP